MNNKKSIDYNIIKKKIIESASPEEIYIFGSFANGKPTKNSDLDICIIKKGIKNISEKIELSNKVRINLEYLNTALDIIIFNKSVFNKRKNIFGSLQYEVFKKGMKIYEK